jgi:hypothetical protein
VRRYALRAAVVARVVRPTEGAVRTFRRATRSWPLWYRSSATRNEATARRGSYCASPSAAARARRGGAEAPAGPRRDTLTATRDVVTSIEEALKTLGTLSSRKSLTHQQKVSTPRALRRVVRRGAALGPQTHRKVTERTVAGDFKELRDGAVTCYLCAASSEQCVVAAVKNASELAHRRQHELER